MLKRCVSVGPFPSQLIVLFLCCGAVVLAPRPLAVGSRHTGAPARSHGDRFHPEFLNGSKTHSGLHEPHDQRSRPLYLFRYITKSGLFVWIFLNGGD